MIRKFRCNDVGNYDDMTIGKIYEGTLNGDGDLLNTTNDVGLGIRIYTSRFTEIGDENDLLKHLEADLVTLQKAAMDKKNEVDALKKKIESTRPVIGSRWVIENDVPNGQTYIIAETGDSRYALISLGNGKRWKDPVNDITQVFGSFFKFKQVNK